MACLLSHYTLVSMIRDWTKEILLDGGNLGPVNDIMKIVGITVTHKGEDVLVLHMGERVIANVVGLDESGVLVEVDDFESLDPDIKFYEWREVLLPWPKANNHFKVL